MRGQEPQENREVGAKEQKCDMLEKGEYMGIASVPTQEQEGRDIDASAPLSQLLQHYSISSKINSGLGLAIKYSLIWKWM